MSLESAKNISSEPSIKLLTLTSSSTVYELLISNRVKGFDIFNRNRNEWHYAWRDGDIGNNIYKTVPSGSLSLTANIDFTEDKTLYIQGVTSGDVLEVELWE